MNEFWTVTTTLIVTLGTVAIISVLFSNKAKTAEVTTAGFSGLGNVFGTVLSPITGNTSFNLH